MDIQEKMRLQATKKRHVGGVVQRNNSFVKATGHDGNRLKSEISAARGNMEAIEQGSAADEDGDKENQLQEIQSPVETVHLTGGQEKIRKQMEMMGMAATVDAASPLIMEGEDLDEDEGEGPPPKPRRAFGDTTPPPVEPPPPVEKKKKKEKAPKPPPPSKAKMTYDDVLKCLSDAPPKSAGLVKCYVERDKKTNRFDMFFDDDNSFLLASMKRPKNKTSNYLVSKAQHDLTRHGDNFFGKLRSNLVGTEFNIYDPGEAPGKRGPQSVRKELGAILYERNVLGTKGPRKMTCIVPSIDPKTEKKTVFR